MRIGKVDLIAYGPFSGETLEFENLERDFHIIYGPNEAGKSSLLRALIAAIFGISERTEDNFRHNNDQLRIGMTLQRIDGASLSFIRKKGRRKTLLDPEEHSIEDSVLSSFWGPLDESHFRSAFGLNHERLIKGGQEIITGGGDIGQSLFEAGSGLIGLPKLLLNLEEEAGKIFSPQGRKRGFNEGLEKYNEARGQLKELSVKSEEWNRLQNELNAATASLQNKGAELQKVRKTLSQLERIQSNLPALAKRASLVMTARDLASIPDLLEDATSKRVRAESEQESAEADLQLTKERIESLTRESEVIQIEDDLLSHADQIDDLYKNIGSFQDAARDIPKRRLERAASLSVAADALREIRADLSLENVETVRLTQLQVVEIRRLIREYNELNRKLESSQSQVNDITEENNLIRNAIEHHSKQIDISYLAASISTVKGLGDLESSCRQADLEIDLERTRIETELSSLPLWDGDIDAFEKKAFPSVTTVNRFKNLVDEIEKERLLTEEQSRQKQQKYQELISELERVQAGGDVPSLDQLQEKRARRDLGWRMIREAFIEKSRSVDAAAALFDPQQPLPDAYERSVAAADGVADLLYNDSDRVAQHETLKRELRQHEKEIDTLQEKIKSLEVRQREVTNEWESHWKAADILPLSPQEMIEWLQRRERILDRIETLRNKDKHALQLHKSLKETRVILNSALNAIGQPVAEEGEGLRSLLIRCERFLEKIRESNGTIEHLNGRLNEQEAKLTIARNRLEMDEKTLVSWRATWGSAIAPIGLGFEASTEQVESVLESLDTVFKALKEVRGFDQRLRGMEATVTDYTHRSRSLLETVAPELSELRPDKAVEALYNRYQITKKEAQRREHLQSEIRNQNERLERTRRKIAEVKTQLSDLCKQAGCKNIEELPSIEKKAAEKQITARALKELEEELITRNCFSLEEIVKEAAGIDRDDLPGRIAALRQEESKLHDEQLVLAGEEADARRAIKSLDGGHLAAAAAEQVQAALAEIRSQAGSYVRLHLSSIMVRRAIDQYRERNQGPLLSRAGSFFSSLTLGNFKGLKSEYNAEDKPILVGVRPNGDHVPVSGMSEGSADQLYLSLRLAAIERYSEASEPCTLILDDILIQFDDDRARAALKILDELSAKTQILFFTHHAHMVSLAQDAIGIDQKRIHQMERRFAKT